MLKNMHGRFRNAFFMLDVSEKYVLIMEVLNGQFYSSI